MYSAGNWRKIREKSCSLSNVKFYRWVRRKWGSIWIPAHAEILSWIHLREKMREIKVWAILYIPTTKLKAFGFAVFEYRIEVSIRPRFGPKNLFFKNKEVRNWVGLKNWTNYRIFSGRWLLISNIGSIFWSGLDVNQTFNLPHFLHHSIRKINLDWRI